MQSPAGAVAVTRSGRPDVDYDLHGDFRMTTMTMGCAGDPGFASSATDDCEDLLPSVFGAQLEICDRIDNNCNGMTDEAMGLVAYTIRRDSLDTGLKVPLWVLFEF